MVEEERIKAPGVEVGRCIIGPAESRSGPAPIGLVQWDLAQKYLYTNDVLQKKKKRKRSRRFRMLCYAVQLVGPKEVGW